MNLVGAVKDFMGWGAGTGLEIGQVSQPWNVPAPSAPVENAQGGADLTEIGATGTPILSGFLRELGEYDPRLTWPAAYMVYEQMRRGDAMVAGTLTAIKARIRDAGRTFKVPDDASAVEKEAAEWIEKELGPKMDAAFENALLMLDFGASMHEDVYEIGDDHNVHLKEMAARLPLTYFRWLCKPGTDELQVIEQLGYRSGQYIRTEVPVGKATLFTFRQEGKNFTGRALLREMYPHWFMKWGLYKVEAISIERGGMGVPVVTMGKDAKKEDRAAAVKWVQELTTHERTGLVLPPEWTFKLEGVTGSVRDPKEAIQHHNMMMATAALIQFMLMGQTHSSGNRALGQTMADFFCLTLKGIADYIAQRISDTTVKRLVDFNFPGVVNYPQIAVQEILSVSYSEVVSSLKDLASDTVDLVRPDDDLEKDIREKFGLPKAGTPRLRVAAPIPTPGVEEDEAGAGQAEPPAPPNKGLRGEVTRPGAGRGKTGPVLAVAASERGTMRAPIGVERCLAASEIIGALDKGRDDVAAALRAARPRVQAEIVHKLIALPVRKMHRASVDPDAKVTAAVKGILEGIAAFGTKQIGDERARQLAGRPVPTAAVVRGADANADPVGLYADAVVSEWENLLQQRATSAMMARRVRQNASVGELITGVGEDLDEQSDKWVDGIASKGANEAFAAGRDEGFAEYADEIDHYVYSAMLDLNCCGNCAAADGAEGSADEVPSVPNEECDGGDRCRCVLVAVFKDEGSVVA